MPDTIVVFTRRPLDELLDTGGSQAWKIRRENARKATYLVCTRNAKASIGNEPHRAGFLIGRISDIVPAPSRAGKSEGRYLIRIDGWKKIDLPELWTFGRNPVHYTNLAELRIDPESIDFAPMPEPKVAAQSPQSAPDGSGMSAAAAISDTKRHLAELFGVDPSAIEITIRA